MRKTYLPLSDEDKNYLKSLSKKRTIQAQVVDRARILLYKADGMTFQEIADKLTISTATVRLCISKFHKGGLDAASLLLWQAVPAGVLEPLCAAVPPGRAATGIGS